MGRIIAMYGPSASGKSDIQKRLSAAGLPRIITATTRLPREGEMDGVHYLFLGREEFRSRIERRELIEFTLYNGEYYGTLRSSAEAVLRGPGAASIIMDLPGVQALKREYPGQVTAIYIGAELPSLKRRLAERGGGADELSARLAKARDEELTPAYQASADALVWNNDGRSPEDVLAEIREIIGGHGQ